MGRVNSARGQHSSLCVSAVVLILDGSDVMEVDEQVDSEREKIEERERERGIRQNENNQRTLKHVTSWMTCRWSECAPKTL